MTAGRRLGAANRGAEGRASCRESILPGVCRRRGVRLRREGMGEGLGAGSPRSGLPFRGALVGDGARYWGR